MDGQLYVKEVVTLDCKNKLPDEVLKLTVPAHRPVKRTTLAKILKQARINLEKFLDLL